LPRRTGVQPIFMDEALEATVIALATGVRRLQPCADEQQSRGFLGHGERKMGHYPVSQWWCVMRRTGSDLRFGGNE
jgi:hypothetical protein